MYFIYTYKWELSAATSHYLEIIQTAIETCGHQVRITHNIREIGTKNTVIVINARAFFEVWIRNPRRPIWCWFQGIIPEEVRLSLGNSIHARLRSKGWKILERFALKHAQVSFFVSEAMREHYQNKYHLHCEHYYIMPCFNLYLDPLAVQYPGKYSNPSFVYAGGTDPWQCIEETLSLYKKIEDQLPNAHLTMLVSDKIIVECLISKYNIKNYTITFVNKEQLSQELQKYKYGFLLRKDHIINNVATPTKFNSYLAAGIIPIYTDAIHAFRDLPEAGIKLRNLSNENENVEIILAAEQIKLSQNEVLRRIQHIFDTYYCEERYIHEIRHLVQRYKQ